MTAITTIIAMKLLGGASWGWGPILLACLAITILAIIKRSRDY